MRTILSTIVLVAAAASQLGASEGGCGEPIIEDEGFDMWCGETLCAWKLVTPAGSIQKAPTWHDGDAGVAFVGSEATIEQLSSFRSSFESCLVFEMVANVPTNAEMFLEIDLHIDGITETSAQIPTSNWKPVSLTFKVSRSFNGIRFRLTKRGEGTAVIAQVHAETDPNACHGFTAIDLAGVPTGYRCEDDEDCASGLCRTPVRRGDSLAKMCVDCDPDVPCPAGQVCGLGPAASPVLALPQMCVPAGRDVLGDTCIADEECMTGLCGSTFVCSTCDVDHPCVEGSGCGTAYTAGPLVCSNGPSGAPCAQHENCESLRCEGQWYSQCPDARPCETDEQCPFIDGEHLKCSVVGITGGTCF